MDGDSHDLTKSSAAPKKSELLVNLRMKGQSKMVYAKYDTFMVGDETSKYLLEISGPSGNAAYPRNMLYYNNNTFSTKDADNDNDPRRSCANTYKGGWWFNGCWLSMHVNGVYKLLGNQYPESIFWNYSTNLQPEFVEMKVRRKN